MSFSGTQIENQINANYNRIDQVGAQLQMKQPAWKSTQLEQELKRLWQAQQYWCQEYRRATGKDMLLFKTMVIAGDPNEETAASKRLAEAKARESAAKNVHESIQLVYRELQNVSLRLQSQYDIAVEWQNALFSDWARMGAGLSARHPLIIKKVVGDRVRPLLLEAERLLKEGKHEKAHRKSVEAARWIKWGYDSLSDYMERLNTGGARAIAGIKISAALATLIVSAPAEVGILGTMGIAAIQEGSQQGTTLVAQAIDPKSNVSLDDLKNAALAVAINAGSAGFAKGLGGLAAKAIGGRAAEQIIKNTPAGETVEMTVRMKAAAFIGQRIEQYVSANAQAIANKMLKLDQAPDWNWWLMIVAPAFNGVAVEMAKERDLQPLFVR